MTKNRGERLKYARSRFFTSARAAALAMGIPAATYGAHERAEEPGGRDYGPNEARRYAQRFFTTPEWLLTGAGKSPPEGLLPDENTSLSKTRGLIGLVERLEEASRLAERQVERLERVLSKIRGRAQKSKRNVKAAKVSEETGLVEAIDLAIRRLDAARNASEKLLDELDTVFSSPRPRVR